MNSTAMSSVVLESPKVAKRVGCKMCNVEIRGTWEIVRDQTKEGISIALACMFDSDGQVGLVTPYCTQCYPKRPSITQLSANSQFFSAQQPEKKKDFFSPKNQNPQEKSHTGQQELFILRAQLEEKDKQFRTIKEQATTKIEGLKKEIAGLAETNQSLREENHQLREQFSSQQTQMNSSMSKEKCNFKRDLRNDSFTEISEQTLISESTKGLLDQLDLLLHQFEAAFPHQEPHSPFNFATVRDRIIAELQGFVEQQFRDRLADSQKGIDLILEQKNKEKSGILQKIQDTYQSLVQLNVPELVVNQMNQTIQNHIESLDKTIEIAARFSEKIAELKQLNPPVAGPAQALQSQSPAAQPEAEIEPSTGRPAENSVVSKPSIAPQPNSQDLNNPFAAEQTGDGEDPRPPVNPPPADQATPLHSTAGPTEAKPNPPTTLPAATTPDNASAVPPKDKHSSDPGQQQP